MSINPTLATGVKLFLESGDRSFLSQLLSMDRSDIEGQAIIRYLMQLKHWPFTPDSEFSEAIEHLFAAYPERKPLVALEYQETTKQLILEAFEYECIMVVPEPKAIEEKPEKVARTKRPKKSDPVERDEYEETVSSSSVDTSGASERLKRVIAIQRG